MISVIILAIEEGEWSSCDSLCTRERISTCKCVDPRTRERVTVKNELCGLDEARSQRTEDCYTRVEHDPWSECDLDCEQRRESKCTCDDPKGGSFQVRKSLCSLSEGHSETRNCLTGDCQDIHRDLS